MKRYRNCETTKDTNRMTKVVTVVRFLKRKKLMPKFLYHCIIDYIWD